MELTIKELLHRGEKILRESGVENYKIEAETLLSFVVGFDKAKLFINQDCEVNERHREAWLGLIARRAAGEPLQYITGEQYFMGHRFSVNPSVLIPRPETELLADKAIEYLAEHSGVKSALDLCTGSGAIAISIAKACPHVKVTASDVSARALALARQNAEDLVVAGSVDFVQSDLFAALRDSAFGEKFDLIVTNPPYIRTGDLARLAREIRDHEPSSALDGGEDGLDFYKRIASDARAYMRSGAILMSEIGDGQSEAVSAIFRDAGFSFIEVFQDLNGIERIIKAS